MSAKLVMALLLAVGILVGNTVIAIAFLRGRRNILKSAKGPSRESQGRAS